MSTKNNLRNFNIFKNKPFSDEDVIGLLDLINPKYTKFKLIVLSLQSVEVGKYSVSGNIIFLEDINMADKII